MQLSKILKTLTMVDSHDDFVGGGDGIKACPLDFVPGLSVGGVGGEGKGEYSLFALLGGISHGIFAQEVEWKGAGYRTG
jgi:hypothetical protein